MSENLVDNWKNLIPFVSSEWVIDWTTEVPLKDSMSAAQSDINTLAVNHGLLTSEVTAGAYKFIGLENGMYIAFVLSGTNYNPVEAVANMSFVSVFPRLCTVANNTLELRSAAVSINMNTNNSLIGAAALKQSNFIIVRVN